MVEDGTLRGAEVFLFTDNSTLESVYYKVAAAVRVGNEG
jgi:hypothetical protein